MAFTVKDAEVIQMADELAARLHLASRIDAIRYALKSQIDITQSRAGDRAAELLAVMEQEVWPLLADGTPIAKSERERVLGYDPETGM